MRVIRWVVVGVLATGGASAASVLIVNRGDNTLDPAREAQAITGERTTLTDNLASFTRTVRVTEADTGRNLDRMAFDCHGGRARVTWHVGNLEPTVPETGIHITVLFDEEPVGTLLKGSTDGIWNDAPAEIEAVVPCAEGAHVLEVRLDSVTGGWGIPYAANPGKEAPHFRVNRGFVVLEVWGRPDVR